MLAFAMFAKATAQTQTSNEKQAAIKELVFLINGDNKMEDLMNALTAQMQSAQDAMFKSLLDERTDLSAADKKELENALVGDRKNSYERFQRKLNEKLNYNEMMSELSSASFDKYYTLDEIKELIVFYKSPVGQKSIKLMPEVTAETMKAVQEKLMPKMMIVIKEIEDENKAELEQKINARKPRPKRTDGK
jgi:hypothetical protein